MAEENTQDRAAVTPHQPGHEKVAAEPSGPRGDNPGTAGQGKTEVRSGTPENAPGKINPSAPGETGTTRVEDLEK